MKQYCPHCQCTTEFDLDDRILSYPVEGETVRIEATVLVCPSCHGIVPDQYLDRCNLSKAYAVYRARHGLLGPDDVRAIRKNYGLTQRAFAKLLGWSPATVNRYEKIGVGTEANNSLLKLMSDPTKSGDLIRQRVGGLSRRDRKRLRLAWSTGSTEPTGPPPRLTVAIRSGLESAPANRESGYRQLAIDRLAQMIALFSGGTGVFKAKLIRLLWYSDFLHFPAHGRGLSGAVYIKLPDGPALRDADLILAVLVQEGTIAVEFREGMTSEGKAWSGEVVKALVAPDLSDFLPSEVEVMTEVRNRLGHLDVKRLSERSRKELAWLEAPDNGAIPYSYEPRLKL